MAGEGEVAEVETEVAPETVESAPETTEAAAPVGQESKAPRTFTDADVQKIVQERLKSWQKYGKPEELDARLSRAEQIEKWAEQMRGQFNAGQRKMPGETAPAAPLSEEDKKVQAYMERLYPGIAKYQEQARALSERLQGLDQFRWTNITENNRRSLMDVATKAGYTADQITNTDPNAACVEKYVADSIRGNAKDYQEYMATGNPAIVQRHFEAVDKWIKGFAPKPPAAPSPNAAKAKDGAKVKSLPPRMPAAGVPAPTSGKRKMTDKERVDAAFTAFSKG